MKKESNSKFMELKVYRNKKNNQLSVQLPRRKGVGNIRKVKFYPKNRIIKW